MFEMLKPKSQLTKAVCLLGMAAFLAACTKSEAPVTQVLSTEPSVSGAPVIGKIGGKGGTKIEVLVNKTPITTNQIRRRAAFVKLRRMKGNSTSIARKELIEEAIKMQEARRVRAVVSDAEVNAAYVRFAKRNKMPVSALTKIMNQRGITKRGFKKFIRASMSWQRAVGARMRAEASGSNTGTPNSPSWLPAVGNQSGKEKEYTIQQIVFIVPAAKRKSLLSRRRTEAKRFRSQLQGCENSKALAANLRDVTVLDRGRLLESNLPPRWKKDIKATPAGKVTRVQDDPKGIEMIAVCKTREVIGQGNSNSEDLFSGKKFQESASALEKKYYKEIEERAVIVRR